MNAKVALLGERLKRANLIVHVPIESISLHCISPPVERDTLAGSKAEDERDDEARDGDTDRKTSKEEIRVFSPPCSIPPLEVVLEEPGNVDTECSVRQVVVAGPSESARESDGGVEAFEKAGHRTPDSLVELGKALVRHGSGESSSEDREELLSSKPSAGEDSAKQKAVWQNRVKLKHVVGTATKVSRNLLHVP